MPKRDYASKIYDQKGFCLMTLCQTTGQPSGQQKTLITLETEKARRGSLLSFDFTAEVFNQEVNKFQKRKIGKFSIFSTIILNKSNFYQHFA